MVQWGSLNDLLGHQKEANRPSSWLKNSLLALLAQGSKVKALSKWTQATQASGPRWILVLSYMDSTNQKRPNELSPFSFRILLANELERIEKR